MNMAFRTHLRHIPFPLKGKDDLIRQMYQDGFSAYKIADSLKASSKSIYYHLKKQGISRNKYRGRSLEPIKSELIEAYQKGIPVTNLAKQYGCSFQTIISLLQKEGIPKRSPKLVLENRKPKIGRLMRQTALIKQLYEQGLSYQNIATKVNSRAENIGSFVRARGWSRTRIIRKNSFASQTNLILKLYKEEHLSAPKIAQEIGCHQVTVLKILKQNGINCRSYMESQIKKLYEAGLTYKEIGNQLGRSESGICRFIKTRGWKKFSEVQ